MLTSDEMNILTVDATLGQPPRIPGLEAKGFYEEMVEFAKAVEAQGGMVWIPAEHPDLSDDDDKPTANFDPDQPRDGQGRWANEGGGAGHGYESHQEGSVEKAPYASTQAPPQINPVELDARIKAVGTELGRIRNSMKDQGIQLTSDWTAAKIATMSGRNPVDGLVQPEHVVAEQAAADKLADFNFKYREACLAVTTKGIPAGHINPTWHDDFVGFLKIDELMRARENPEKGISVFERMAGGAQLSPEVHVTPTKRAGAGRGHIYIGPHEFSKVMVHELGHIWEESDPTVHQAVTDFIAQRTHGEHPQLLARVLEDPRYQQEKCKPDKFFHPYVGKVCRSGGSEVISMGMEEMYNDPHKFLKADPGHFKLIYGLMHRHDGEGRP